jgi:hypothetical protein
MRFGGFGSDNNVCSICGGFQGDRFADASRRAGNEKCPSS